MEAKDTVMNIEQQKPYADGWGFVCRQGLLNTQAEISFKAGIKEVVEWAEANLIYPTRGEGICFERNMEWQSKLKEWGIK